MAQHKSDDQSGWILWLNQQSFPIRLLSFIFFIVLIVGLIIAITVGLYYVNVTNFPRLQPIAIAEDVTLQEYATFEDEETYPAAVTSAADGTLYTGSFITGAVWRVNADGTPQELPQTRAEIGSIIGLDVAPDGTLYILDYLDAFDAGGAKVWQWRDDSLSLVWDTTADGGAPINTPNDIAVDADNRLYLLDISSRQIVRIAGDTSSVWWSTPDNSYQIAGLAYHSVQNAIVITDAARNAIYQIPVEASDTEAEREIIVEIESIQGNPPAFNGITTNMGNAFYVAAFDRNEIWEIIPGSPRYTVLAENYRGSSDVAYDAANNRLYVNNWDQSWLVPITLVFFQIDVAPRLPFSIDVIQLDQ